MISEPFLHIPIIVPGNPQADPPEESKQVVARLQPCEIAVYYPGYHFGSMIYLKCGSVLMTEHTCEAIDLNIAEYWKKVEAIMNKPKIQTFG